MEGINIEQFFTGLTSNLEPQVRHHLKNVYGAVALASVSAATGAFVHLYSTTLGAGILTSLAAIGMLMTLMMTPHDGKNDAKRLGFLSGFAFFSGVNLGPLLQVAIMLNPSIVIEALVTTAVVFTCFSLSALYAPRGHFLYLGGSLFSLLSTLFWLGLLNMFIGSQLLYQARLYLTLAVMCGFIVYDTQLITEKRRRGNTDYILHGLELFIDALAVFKRLMAILADKEANKKRRSRRN